MAEGKMVLLRVFSESNLTDESAWRKALEIGADRTFDQDPKYALRLLVDIAIKALSPAINDPTTAVQALDQIQDQLVRLGNRRLEIGAVRDSEGRIRVAVHHPTWEDFLSLAFEEIRAYGSTSLQVMRRMRALIHDLIANVPEERHAALEYQLERLERYRGSFGPSPTKMRSSRPPLKTCKGWAQLERAGLSAERGSR